jgi:two-component system LytT family response regulator
MPKKYTCILIDDEPKAISVLSSLVSKIDDLEERGRFTDPFLALSKVQEINPDIVFVDIEMPNKNGFEVVDEMRLLGLKSTFIFTTGYDQFAVKAIKKQAFDYLLKPITQSDIFELLARIKQFKKSDKDDEMELLHNGRLRFNTLNGFYIVELEDIVFVKADGNYSELHMRDGSFKLITSNMAKIESLLDMKIFCRIGRSIIINTDFLTQVDRRKGTCILTTGQSELTLPISKKRIKELADMFG